MGIFDDIRGKLLGESPEKPTEDQDSSDQSGDEIRLAAYVKTYFDECRTQSNRVAHEGVWMSNIAALLGFGGMYYDAISRQFRPTDSSSRYLKRNRIRANLLLSSAQNRLARMLKNPPKYDVRPKSMDEEDKEAARLGLEVIGQVWDEQKLNRKRIDLGMHLIQCGHAYFHVSYDPELGDPIPSFEEPGPDGEAPEVKYQGALRIDIVPAFEGFPDPMAKSFDELSKFGIAKVRTLDYFRNRFDKGHMVKEEGPWLLSIQNEMRVNTLASNSAASSGTTQQMKNSAIELSYYEKRSKDYPQGRHVIVANGVVLKNDELPVGEIPLSMYCDAIIGGKFYPEALLTHARPLQEQYDRNLEKRKQWTDKLLAGKYIAAKGHGLIQEALNDQSGEVVEYDPVPGAPEPSAMQIPVMPQYIYTECDSLKKDLYEIQGISEISRGQLPSASIPAQGMQILIEQDETRMGIEVEQHEHADARVGMLILKYTDKYVVDQKELKTKGKNLEYQIKSYTGQDLRKNFDVMVVRGSTTPNVKVLERQEIMNVYAQGLLGAPEDPTVREKVLGMLEFGQVNEVWEDQRLDMTQINRTIDQIEQEQIPQVNKLDNHPMHILIKNRYRKSEKYLLLSPMSQQILEADLQAHAEAMMGLVRPDLMQPPDEGPPPDQAIAEIHQQANADGVTL